MVSFVIPSEVVEMLFRPVEGYEGGFERLIGRLQRGTTRQPSGSARIAAREADCRRIVKYSHPKYGAGTYQKILRAIKPYMLAVYPEAEQSWVTGQLAL